MTMRLGRSIVRKWIVVEERLLWPLHHLRACMLDIPRTPAPTAHIYYTEVSIRRISLFGSCNCCIRS